jgi:predicted membrane channel-forming protein YqfA (hemolysin III family)
MARTKHKKHQCEQCGETAKRHVLATDPATGAEIDGWLCPSCVTRYRRRRQISILVYLALQVCWLTFFKNGLSIVGVMGAFVGAWSLYHLVKIVAGMIWHVARPDSPAPAWMEAYCTKDSAEKDLLLELRRA